MMVGSELPDPGTRESTVTDREVLRVEGLTLAAEEGRPLLADVDLVVHAGEVLGIAGVEGNGQTELVETIMGMRHARRAGSCSAGGTSAAPARWPAARPGSATSPKTARATACWPRSRCGRTGSSATRPARPSPGPAGSVCWTWPPRAATPSASSPSSTCAPRAWTCRPPRSRAATSRSSSSAASCRATRCCSSRRTRRAGWTSARRPAIWEELRKARAAGLAVLLISADLDELIGLSDSIAVILRGRLVATADPATGHPRGAGRRR